MDSRLVTIVFLSAFLFVSVIVILYLVRGVYTLSKLREIQLERNECLENENSRLRGWAKYPKPLLKERMKIVDEYGYPHIYKVVKELRGGDQLKMIEINPPVTEHVGNREKKNCILICRDEFEKYDGI
jgi:hypothetical protein